MRTKRFCGKLWKHEEKESIFKLYNELVLLLIGFSYSLELSQVLVLVVKLLFLKKSVTIGQIRSYLPDISLIEVEGVSQDVFIGYLIMFLSKKSDKNQNILKIQYNL